MSFNSVVKPGEDGPDIRTCIDGKQRLTSIHRYGEFGHLFTWHHTHLSMLYRFMDGLVCAYKDHASSMLISVFADLLLVLASPPLLKH